MSVRYLFLALGLLVAQSAIASNASVLQQARERLAGGEGEAAYALLAPLEDRLAGDPGYDLLLAQAALGSGRANIALFVLERVVIAHPGLPQARLLMASAYIHLQAYSQAVEILEALLQAPGLDTQSRRQAEQMLTGIRDHTRHSRLAAYFGFGIGQDSNANAATANTTFLGYNLAANSIATPSATVSWRLGARSVYRLPARDRIFAAVDWAENAYPNANFVNNDSLGFQLVWQGGERYALGYQNQTVNLDGALNNRGNHLFGLIKTDTSMQWQPFIRLGEVRYDKPSSLKDVRQAIIGTQFSLSDWIGGTRMSILLAEDSALEAGSPYSRRIAGWQILKESRYLERVRVSYKAGALYSRYEGQFFGNDREERQSTLGVDIHYRAAQHWDFSLSAGLTDARSTIALYEYDRVIMGLNVKRNFVR
jgi:hypothetical protein